MTTVSIDALSRVSVLAVDDDRATLQALTLVLESHGARVHAVNSAAAALAFYEMNAFPDVIISDVTMTGTDGLAMIAAIRAAEVAVRRAPTPAVAVSGYTTPADELRALAAGFQVHIAKPIDIAVLLTTISNLVARNGPSAMERRREAGKR